MTVLEDSPVCYCRLRRHDGKQRGSSAPEKPDGGIAFEKIKTDAGHLSARTVQATVAVDQQARIVAGNGHQHVDLFGCGKTELRLSRLTRAQYFAGPAQADRKSTRLNSSH